MSSSNPKAIRLSLLEASPLLVIAVASVAVLLYVPSNNPSRCIVSSWSFYCIVALATCLAWVFAGFFAWLVVRRYGNRHPLFGVMCVPAFIVVPFDIAPTVDWLNAQLDDTTPKPTEFVVTGVYHQRTKGSVDWIELHCVDSTLRDFSVYGDSGFYPRPEPEKGAHLVADIHPGAFAAKWLSGLKPLKQTGGNANPVGCVRPHLHAPSTRSPKRSTLSQVRGDSWRVHPVAPNCYPTAWLRDAQ